MTLFYISCVDWLEWIPTTGGYLSYKYSIRQIGSPRSFLLYAGTSATSTPLVLPVGDMDNEDKLEVVVSIVDSVTDYYLLVQTVKVLLKLISHVIYLWCIDIKICLTGGIRLNRLYLLYF